jgi:8-oxo-dGDP phosphatase
VSAFAHETLSRTPRYSGPIFSVFTDEVTMSGGSTAERDVTENKGAVGVVAVDDVGRVVLIRQYRHPVHRRLWELPAGLRDVDGEDLAVTAGRELAEEADLHAARWDLLVDLHTSPGFSN